MNDLLVFGHRAFDGLAMARVTEVAAVFAAEAGVEDAAVAHAYPGLALFCLERVRPKREKWTSADIGRVLEGFPEELARHLRQTCLPYATLTAPPPGARQIAPEPGLRRRLDDKRSAKGLFASVGLPTIDGIVQPISADALEQAVARFGYPLVLRAPFGSSGNATFLVAGPEDRVRLAGIASTTPWLLERCVTGYSINATALATDHATALFPPSVQVIGQPACGSLVFGYCGSDFAGMGYVPVEVRSAVADQTQRVGEAVRGLGYRGVFGVDFVVGVDGAVFPIEINARYQNSTALLHFGLPRELAPAALHVDGGARAAETRDLSGPRLAQVMVYSDPTPAEQVAQGSVRPGIYRRTPAGWRFGEPGFDPNRLGPDDVLVVGTPERAGITVAAGSALARLVFADGVLDGDLATLKANVIDAIRWLRAAVDVTAAERDVA